LPAAPLQFQMVRSIGGFPAGGFSCGPRPVHHLPRQAVGSGRGPGARCESKWCRRYLREDFARISELPWWSANRGA